MGAGAQAWLSKTFNVLYIVHYPKSTIGSNMFGAGEKAFEITALRWLENGILGSVFVITVFHESAILQLFEAEFTEDV